ncbi:MAG TPA: lactonase family protein [Thermomicrobiales bacterium]
MTASGNAPFIFIGTYTESAMHGQAEGIYVYRMDSSSGALTHVRTIAGVVNPSFLAIDPARRHLFAVNETERHDGQPGGGVSAFALDAAVGNLTPRNTRPTRGTFPAHLTVDPTGAYVLVANYGSGNVAVYPLAEGDDLGAMSDLVQNTGSGPNKDRQAGPHAHMITFDPSGRYALLVDLGIDKTLVYRLDTAKGTLNAHDIATDGGATEQSCGRAAPGAGPRHIAFHPTNRYAYVINELSSTIDAFGWDAARGTLAHFQTIATQPPDATGANSGAEIAVHLSGRFLYGSNRGHNTIALFAIDQTSGELTARGHEPTQGKNPRSFTLDPTGAFLLVANQDSDNVVTFRIDQTSGTLSATGSIAQIPTPVCLLFG